MALLRTIPVPGPASFDSARMIVNGGWRQRIDSSHEKQARRQNDRQICDGICKVFSKPKSAKPTHEVGKESMCHPAMNLRA